MNAEKVKTIGDDEKNRWESTYSAIVSELKRSESDFQQDQTLARELTSQIVNSTRDEDKAALASDEAVAHGLSKLRKNKSQDMERLLDVPYFARVVTDENGKQVEFKLSTASFPAQKIIDWRKAPISKLYYDYSEGEDFSEIIQGREREGLIKLRRSYQGKANELNVIETAEGTIYWDNNQWNHDEKSLTLSRKAGQEGHLPPILSLITPDQFKLITRDPELPMVIQGIAGSGKTTVALHRLAWLLHEDNSSIKANKTLVVMLNRSLKNYVENTLPELNIEGVAIRTYYQWVNSVLNDLVGPRPRADEKLGHDVELFKSSASILTLIETYSSRDNNSLDPIDDFFNFLNFLITTDTHEVPDEIIKKIRYQYEKRFFDGSDDTLLLHLIYQRKGCLPAKHHETLVDLEHIVIDECQDFGVTEIRALLYALKPNFTVTLVGDKAQKIVMNRGFNNWSDFLKGAGFKNLTPLELNVSYRTTEEIMEVASALRDDDTNVQIITKRHGPVPRLLRAEEDETLPYLVGQWIDDRLRESAHSLSAIICRWPKEAQKLVENLRKLGYASVRLGYRDQFSFAPGIVVTNVNQVKGLEFRNVLIFEPTETNYKFNNEEEQNLLYVAVTRAEVMLDFVTAGPITTLLPDTLEEEVISNTHPEREPLLDLTKGDEDE